MSLKCKRRGLRVISAWEFGLFCFEVQLPALKARAVQIGGERGRLEGAVFGQTACWFRSLTSMGSSGSVCAWGLQGGPMSHVLRVSPGFLFVVLLLTFQAELLEQIGMEGNGSTHMPTT